ncbi:intradiol ring-cleavage dioxygenase [Niabella beijingensis]|uniref:dioxygenase family protein n=1 Tax=Niabella beijingensis TaxID=2872700 RepID=UPI001CBF89A3|nr:intradiol ring-cleavage dioxygenase [Niabella beijingensis]MBZ4191426.1 intradiol ring-cleavage dioxygenase [Niabella beijingensis]
MERKLFLRNGIAALGLAFVAPLAKSCSKTDAVDDTTDTTTGDGTGTTANCTSSPSETEGPFPTKTPSGLVQSDITGDRMGVTLGINIAITNVNQSCAALAGTIVDIWHCDAQGNYSEYGGSGMQSTNYTSVHWLRGRQTTDENGKVTFTSIFPGWYSGRAPHIHVHVYNASGTSLLVTQIAFPTDVCNTVYTTAADYKARGTQDTANARDNVFADSLAAELATVTGTVAAGYTLSHTIGVKA